MSDDGVDFRAILMRAQPHLLAFWRVVLSVFLIGAYLVMLMTSVAQQRIIESLSSVENGSKVGYNEALNVLQLDDNEVRQRAKGLTSAEVVRQLETTLASGKPALRGLDQRFNDVAGRAADSGCPVPAAKQDPGAAISSLQDVRRCTTRQAGISGNDGSAAVLGADADKLIQDYNGWLNTTDDLNAKYADAQRKLEAEKTQSATPVLSNVSPAKLRMVFSEIFVIRNVLGPLGTSIIALPPFALQVLLALLSGIAGALLVALVLIVYPHNKISLGRSANFEATLALGGLVAICIHLVLGAGSSVLGAPLAGADAAKVNVSALSFICLLAGAFSDQVADWLSKRATTLFAQQDEGGAGADNQQQNAAGPVQA